MIVVLILGVLMNLAAPAFVHARDSGYSRSCVSNLKKFQGAKEQYALENRVDANSATPITWPNIAPYLRFPNASPTTGPVCPVKGDTYTYGALSQNPICAYGAPSTDATLIHALK